MRLSFLTPLRALVALVVLGAVVVVLLVVRHDDPSSTPEPAAAPEVTTLAQLAGADVAVARGAFCDRVPSSRVADALGGEAADTTEYANGDTALLGTIDDVAHEFGCTWTSSTGAVARAWVFAPPVTTARAGRLARLATREEGCTPTPTTTAYGDPGAATTCTTGTEVTSGHAGLFGDAWLRCTLSGPAPAAPDLQARADAWCVAVAVAASSPAP